MIGIKRKSDIGQLSNRLFFNTFEAQVTFATPESFYTMISPKIFQVKNQE